MKQYVLTFLFNEDLSEVLLIKKNRPDWQAGKYNGIGGKIEKTDDYPFCAAIREIEEECGLGIHPWGIEYFAKMQGVDFHEFQMHCYCGCANIHEAKSLTDEPVEIIKVEDLHKLKNSCVNNLTFLIYMAECRLRTGNPRFAEITHEG